MGPGRILSYVEDRRNVGARPKKRIGDFSQIADSKTKNFREFRNVFRNVAETTGDNREGRIWCTRQELNLEPADP